MSAISRISSRAGFTLKKYSPEILTGAGVLATVTAAVLAARATLKLEEVVAELEFRKGSVHEKLENQQITADEAKRELIAAHRGFVFDLIKLYGPAVSLGTLGITSIVSAQGIMRKRNLAVLGAYKSIEQAYSEYRKRVVEAVGEDREREIRLGLRAVDESDETEYEGEDGPLAKDGLINSKGATDYSVLFDQFNPNYSTAPFYNQNFVKGQENFANQRLRSKGHLFLNEVYESLGFPATPEGALVGWVSGQGDNFVNFGIWESVPGGPTNEAFASGEERSAWLQFNVDGVIWDKI